MTPWLDDGDVRLYHGDNLDVLRAMPDRSVHMCATSPPFYGLRSYLDDGHEHKHIEIGLEDTPDQWVERLVLVFREVRRVLRDDGTLWVEIGDSYAGGNQGGTWDKLGQQTKWERKYQPAGWTKRQKRTSVDTTAGCKPKDLLGQPWLLAFALRQPWYAGSITNEVDRTWLAAMIDGEGSIALNYLRPTETNGRKRDYYGPYLRVHNTSEAIVRRCAALTGVGSVKVHDSRGRPVFVWAVYGENARSVLREVYPYLVAKQHEARLAYAQPGSEDAYAALKLIHKGSDTTVDRPAPPSCHEPGWYLRSEIIWARPNPMPESVTDRPTKSHSTVFLLSKQPRYFYDADAIREAGGPSTWGPNTHGGSKAHAQRDRDGGGFGVKPSWSTEVLSTANARSVWTIPTQPTPFAHFATWPEALVRRMILAGTSERGCCPECGAPWTRDVESELRSSTYGDSTRPDVVGSNDALDRGQGMARAFQERMRKTTTTLGWSPSCAHDTPPVPCTVLDPFAGSATTMLVARNHGRHSIGIELNESYLEIAAKRLQQLSLFSAGRRVT